MKNINKDIAISDLIYKSLYGKLSEDERTLLDCWLLDESNRRLYEELQEPENLYEGVLEMAELDLGQYYHSLQRQMNYKRRLRLWGTIASVAAVLLPCIWMASSLWQKETNRQEEVYQIVQQSDNDRTMLKTGEGEVYYIADSVRQIKIAGTVQKEFAADRTRTTEPEEEIKYNLLTTSSKGNISVTLNDSTRVWLNAGSRLRYPNCFSKGKREVELSGEAYFEVARNEQKPFIVKAGTTRIEVLGTRFNVNTEWQQSCVTTLVEGCVKVRNKVNDSVVIHSGQQVEVPLAGVMTVKSVDTRFYTAWQRNRFAFQNETFYQIMEQLSEWYDCTFEFNNLHLGNLHFTTMIPRYDEISEVLGILQATREFGFIQTGRHISIIDYGDNTK